MFFAALALSRFADVPSQRISAGANIPWGNNLEAAARADDKLIFVYRAGEKFSPQVQKQIFENYIAAEFDPQRWPADNEIFGSIISGGGDRAMLFGILTPRLVPLFLTSKRDVVIDGKKVDLAALLSTTSDFYRQNRLRVYETARIVEREKLASATVPASGKATAGGVAGRGIKAESDAVSKFLSGASAPASANAVFSESVRLGVELHKKIPSPELGSSLSAAAKILSENIADRARKFCARLLCARALSEYAQQFADGDAKNVLAAFADEVLAQQHSNGFLYGPADKFPTLRANAIGAGFLIRASKVLARPDCLKAAVDIYDGPAAFSVGPVEVETMEACHPGGCTIYKIICGGISVVYATDYEPESDSPDDFCAFAQGCTLLLLDAQYTRSEYERNRGFGHSTIPRSAAIARRCGAEQTLLIHHDPTRTDRQLLELEAAVHAQYPNVRFGRGGEEVLL